MSTDRDPAKRRIPFGYNKGKLLGDVPDEELRGLREWCQDRNEDGTFDSLLDDIDQVLENRQGLPLELGEAYERRRRT